MPLQVLHCRSLTVAALAFLRLFSGVLAPLPITPIVAQWLRDNVLLDASNRHELLRTGKLATLAASHHYAIVYIAAIFVFLNAASVHFSASM